MVLWVAALQTLLIGAVLLYSSAVKLAPRRSRPPARGTALARLVGERRAAWALRLVGVVELTLGAALVLPPALPVEAVAATALALGFLGYLGYARAVVPDSSCGCLSTRRTPVSWRSFARGGLMLGAAVLAVPAATSWLDAAGTRPVAGTVLLLAEAAAVIALSAELDAWWLLPLRRLRVRLSHPLAGHASRLAGLPLDSSVDQLQHSAAYRSVAHLLRSDVVEHWDEDDWRILVYSARYGARATTAVFAVPRLRYEPQAVRVALVDDQTGAAVDPPDPTTLDRNTLNHSTFQEGALADLTLRGGSLGDEPLNDTPVSGAGAGRPAPDAVNVG
ncbi:MAG TPA: MauE/DoxX family redox-associated membrane protein [Micromonosporaceae bacterium]|nr:MauE/DoxX family redox-associated membrane protein [Micromonosporaceae bacterium]